MFQLFLLNIVMDILIRLDIAWLSRRGCNNGCWILFVQCIKSITIVNTIIIKYHIHLHFIHLHLFLSVDHAFVVDKLCRKSLFLSLTWTLSFILHIYIGHGINRDGIYFDYRCLKCMRQFGKNRINMDYLNMDYSLSNGYRIYW